MALFFKKKKEEEAPLPEMPEMTEGEELPPLPPLPGEEELAEVPPPMPFARKMAPPPVVPEIPMAAPQMPPKPFAMMAPPPASEKATVFIRIDKYRDIMRTVQEMESKVEELRATLDRISSIKGREAEIIDGWNAMLQDTKAKLDDIHSKLTRPEA